MSCVGCVREARADFSSWWHETTHTISTSLDVTKAFTITSVPLMVSWSHPAREVTQLSEIVALVCPFAIRHQRDSLVRLSRPLTRL